MASKEAVPDLDTTEKAAVPRSSSPTGENDSSELQDETDHAKDKESDEEGEGEAEVAQQEEEGAKPVEDDAWQAVFSPEANAWYFWNSKTNQTTWENPKQSTTETSSTTESAPNDPSTSTSAQPPLPEESTSTDGLPPIDPDLAWLDPSAARGSSSTTATQAARFNARTGRFQVDPKFTPDRISDYQRSHRQQEAYYDVKGWEQQLEGKGLKRAGEDAEDAEGSRKRPSSKQVEKFKQQKQEKKKKKLTSWLAN